MFKKNIVADKKLFVLRKSILIYFFLLVLFFSLFFIVHAIAMTLITIPAEVEVQKSIIELKDIAKMEGDDPEVIKMIEKVELGHSPSPGEEKSINRNYIILRLKKEGFETSDIKLACNENIILRRSSRTLKKEYLENIAKEELYKYLGVQNNKMIIQNLKGLDDIEIPEGELEYKLEIRRKMSKYGRVVGYLVLIVNDELYKKIWIQAKVAFYVKVGIVDRDLKKGDGVRRGDIRFDEILLNDMSKDYITNAGQTTGLAASRNLRKGTVLHRGFFTKPILINRGDEVLIEVKMNSLKITAAGTALEKGGLGDVIKVKNNPTQKTIQGKIASKGRVIIE